MEQKFLSDIHQITFLLIALLSIAPILKMIIQNIKRH